MATLETTIPAQIAAGVGDQIIGEAPFDGTVTEVSIMPEAAVTGATSTKRTFTVVNKGQSGVGTTVVATLDLITGENLVAFDEKPFTLSVVANATTVAKGDVLAIVEAVTSTGTAHTGGNIKVEITPRNV